ncbi:MAG: polysaccharide pyruvyl transferase family protein, partial [Lachnospiraceae bacterium]|nr:polysaccharide pyruvyl transferase family protein [Lachnospiraceae bacterium]
MVTKRGKQILVLGASFQNKGAQAMLFSTISEFSKRFPESVFYFSTDCVYENEELYKFTPVNTHYENRYHVDIKQLISDIIHGKSNMTTKYPEIKGVMNDIDFVVDISGYALGSDWNYIRNKYYLDIIKFVKSYGKTIYLMPQSFGPFDYKEKETELKKSISKIMKYPKVIFAREMEGKESLENEFKLKNVRYSPDIVLQSDKINIESVFNKKIDLKIPEINSKKNVCIIPNRQIFKRGNEKKILGLYDNIINKLIS